MVALTVTPLPKPATPTDQSSPLLGAPLRVMVMAASVAGTTGELVAAVPAAATLAVVTKLPGLRLTTSRVPPSARAVKSARLPLLLIQAAKPPARAAGVA